MPRGGVAGGVGFGFVANYVPKPDVLGIAVGVEDARFAIWNGQRGCGGFPFVGEAGLGAGCGFYPSSAYRKRMSGV